MLKQSWKIDEIEPNVHRINAKLGGVGSTFRVLLQSDVHWDNPHCNRNMFKRHLEEALDLNAPVFGNGDLFCAMQGKYDKRSSKKDIRPEHMQGDYFDRLIETAAEYLKPYAKVLTVQGLGNHETAVSKNHEVSLTKNLVSRLREFNPNIYAGGYSGYVVFQINFRGKSKTFKLFYNHGSGGGGPVTRGVIQTNRQAVYLADADIVWHGHTHDSWSMPIARIHLDNRLHIQHGRQLHVKTAGYKEEYDKGMGGFHIETGKAPKPIGAYWLEFKLVDSETVQVIAIEAI